MCQPDQGEGMSCFLKSIGALLLIGCLLTLSIRDTPAQESRGGAVPLERLPEELRNLSPKDHFVPSSQKQVGVIDRMTGNVVIVHGVGKQAYFGMEGDPLYEKDTLITLAESKCHIQLLDGDAITVASETEFTLESFQEAREEGRKSSLIRMLKGRALFYAMRLFSYKDGKFIVATPTNAIGVRGTKFGVHVYILEDRRSVTDCFCEEGIVDVDGKTVVSGNMYNGLTGQVIPTPADVLRSFKEAAEFRTEPHTGPPPDRPIPPPVHVPPTRPVTPPSVVTPPRPPPQPPQPDMHIYHR